MAAPFLVNLLFWSGVSIGGVMLAALVDVTGGQWLGPMRDSAERMRRFLPLSFALLLVWLWRSGDVYPWARVSERGWFQPMFVALRDAVACLVVYASAFAYCRASDQRSRHGVASPHRDRAAVALILIYAVGFSLLAIDLIMSLEPRWTSTLFPAYVFSGNVYAGTAAVAAIAAWRSSAAKDAPRMRDMANLLVGLALFWAYLFWSQFLVIWYGNVTAEVGFMMARIGTSRPLGWVVLIMCAAIPALALVPAWGKRRAIVGVSAVIVLVGLWLEHWLLVVPDVPGASVGGAVLVTIGFAVGFAVCVY